MMRDQRRPSIQNPSPDGDAHVSSPVHHQCQPGMGSMHLQVQLPDVILLFNLIVSQLSLPPSH
eukprot:3707786-Rhodomonas_salina.1